MADIPPEILKKIKESAAEEWPDNREMRTYTVETECASYVEFVGLDFDMAQSMRESIVALAEDYSDSWEERTTFCKDQVVAFKELHLLDLSCLPDDFTRDLLSRAEQDSDGDFEQKLDFIKRGIARHHEVERIRAEIAPIRHLLIRMENIIGNECYNGSIQNYGAFGEWEGEGRSFRYPVTFIKDGKEFKRHAVLNEFPDDVMMTGRYKFGANELSIFRALLKIVQMLRDEYGLDVKSVSKSKQAKD